MSARRPLRLGLSITHLANATTRFFLHFRRRDLLLPGCYRVRDNGGTGMGGCGDSRIFAFSSATADSRRLISRAIWS